MKFFSRYIFPALFGLLIYTSLRLVNDSMQEEQFWDRPLQQNLIEIGFVVMMGYVSDALLRRGLERFRKGQRKTGIGQVMREFGVVALVCLLLFNPVLFLIHYLINDPVDWNDFIIGNFLILLYVLLYYAIARGNRILHSYIEQKTQLEKVKNDQLQTELKFLRAQYHPHFLFNALNTIYFQMDESIPAAKETVEKFAELLRYQLYDQQMLVPVTQELGYLQNFIFLQKARMPEQLKLEVNFDEFLHDDKVYPLLFLPLVENAFKYTGGNYVIRICARKENDGVIFTVINSIPGSLPAKKEGIGLENLRRRLELLYPGAHEFHAAPVEQNFKARLKIPLYGY